MEETEKLSWGDRIADHVTGLVGSWFFIGWQSFFLVLWIVINSAGFVNWDLYPFVLLNLVLSFQAAYTAPFILMSQNRQSTIDRRTIQETLQTEIKEMQELEELRSEIKKLSAMLQQPSDQASAA